MSSVTALLQCHPPTDQNQLPPVLSVFRAWLTPLWFWIYQDKILVSPFERRTWQKSHSCSIELSSDIFVQNEPTLLQLEIVFVSKAFCFGFIFFFKKRAFYSYSLGDFCCCAHFLNFFLEPCLTSIGRECLATVNGTSGSFFLSLPCCYKLPRQGWVQRTDKVKRYFCIKMNTIVKVIFLNILAYWVGIRVKTPRVKYVIMKLNCLRKTIVVKTKIPSQSQGQFYFMEVKLWILIKQFFLGGSWEGNFKVKFRNET